MERAQLSCISRNHLCQLKVKQKAILITKSKTNYLIPFSSLFFLEYWAWHWWLNYSPSQPVCVLVFLLCPGMMHACLLMAAPMEMRTNIPLSIKYNENLLPFRFFSSPCSFLSDFPLPPSSNEVSCWLHLFFVSKGFFFAALKTQEDVCELRRRWSRILSYCSLLTQQVLICSHAGHFFPFTFMCSSTKTAFLWSFLLYILLCSLGTSLYYHSTNML